MSTQTLVDPSDLPAPARWRKALGALAKVLADPEQTDQVLVFSMYINAGTMRDRIGRFYADPRGQRLFDEHRAIDAHTIDLDALAQLPEGTLGRAYANFLRSRNLTPDVFEGAPPEIRDPRVAYVIQRLRQTHDLWHVVTGYGTDPSSEVALQAFSFAQVRAPSSLLLALAGTVRGSREKPTLARDVLAGFRLGRRAERLATFPWEDHWATPLSDVRAMLGLPLDTRTAERAAA
jgi:ubiquinone biosynthesis protein COQ4